MLPDGAGQRKTPLNCGSEKDAAEMAGRKCRPLNCGSEKDASEMAGEAVKRCKIKKRHYIIYKEKNYVWFFGKDERYEL